MATNHHHPEHHSQPVLESAMDYVEHEKTYNGFIVSVKWSIYLLAALLIILFFVIRP
ncbi:aa3-type cytochrome c oxidase subunit IV [Devosia sp. BK]|jgi:hypothetical protein|uniref:aa3-type cytochrome c oxidase subunit IV n=1 Tax=unclassified Devosia TaxID=196773 RepID=UPI0009ECB415|nr:MULTISPECIES: aa3-type cytochrome c oxidase subunit IV [unclassified Devosia]MDV3252919.1 aa3-type cytochrome c oxidase subunit IV [Devosia sp. BK]